MGGDSLGVPHHSARARSRADEAAIRLIASRSAAPPPFQTERQSENSRGGRRGWRTALDTSY